MRLEPDAAGLVVARFARDHLVAVAASRFDLAHELDRRAARHPIDGIDRVVRFVARLGPKLFGSAPSVPAWSGDVDVRIGPVNGEPGFVVRREGEVVHAGTIEVAEGAITSIWWVVNPDKLHWVDADGP